MVNAIPFGTNRVQEVEGNSTFAEFYETLRERIPLLTDRPTQLLKSLGTPTFRTVESLDYPLWAQVVHALYPCHLGHYHGQTAFGFTTGNVIGCGGSDGSGSVSFEMNRFHIFPGHNRHNFWGPLLFGVGHTERPHLVFGVIPRTSGSHLLEVSIYAQYTSRVMRGYYRLIKSLFEAIAKKSIAEDKELYERYSNKDAALAFLSSRGGRKQTPTSAIRSLYWTNYGDLLDDIERVGLEIARG